MKTTVRSVFVSLVAVMWAVACAPWAGAQERGMTTVYLVLLEKGPAWTPEETSATEALQKEHMTNIRTMFRNRKLIIAGPVDDEGGLRGIFVLAAESLDEAKALAASDPAVKAGRLVPAVYPWWVEKGALPDAGTYCAPPAGE